MRRRSIILAATSSMAVAAMEGLTIVAVGVRCAQAARPGALEAAADALGVNEIKTLQFTATRTSFTVGQNFPPDEPWPPVPIKSYTALINYETGSMQQELVREMGPTMPRGGGVPFTGEVRQVTVVSAGYAWTVPVSATASS